MREPGCVYLEARTSRHGLPGARARVNDLDIVRVRILLLDVVEVRAVGLADQVV